MSTSMFKNFGLTKVNLNYGWLQLVFNFNIRRLKCSNAIKGPPWNILFFGTDNFALPTLKVLWAKYNTGTVISNLGVVAKNNTIVKKYAESEKLTTYDWPLDIRGIESKYHIGMVVSFGNLIPEEVINAFPLGCINVHASLLPKWRGAAPIIHSVINGDMETGVTIMRIHPHKFDVGEIVRQYRISIGPDETSEELEKRLSDCGASLLLECIRDMPRCIHAAVPQPKTNITYAPKLSSRMSHIDWTSMSSQSIYNLHRAICHLYPLTANWHGLKVKLHGISLHRLSQTRSKDSSISSVNSASDIKKSALDFLNSPSVVSDLALSTSSTTAGCLTFLKEDNLLVVDCIDGRSVSVKEITVKNKRMSPRDFFNGFISKKPKEKWKFSC